MRNLTFKTLNLMFNHLTYMVPLTGPKTKCTLIAKARKLALYTWFCINGYNMKTKRPTEEI